MLTNSWNNMIYYVYVYTYIYIYIYIWMCSTCISGNASVVASKFWFIKLGFCMINTRTGYIEASFIISACVSICCLLIVM